MNRQGCSARAGTAAVLLGLLCWQSVEDARCLLAEETARAMTALPEPGGVRELPTATSQAVALANPDFEQQWDGWTPPDQEAFSMETQPGAAHSGQSCLRFDCGQQTRYVPSLRQKIGGIGSGVYVLRFWLKLDGVSVQTRQTSGVRVSIEYLLKNGQRAWPSTTVFRGTADWQQQELKAYIPPEADPASVAISIHRYGSATSGTAWFDDFSLTYLRPPAIETFLLYPNFRGYLSADEPAAVRLWVRRDAAQTQAAIRVEVHEGGERRVIASKVLAGDVGEQIVELDSSAWPVGSYALEARAGEFCSTPIVVQKISAAERQRFSVWFDANQVLHFHGKPVFPIGLYNTTRHFHQYRLLASADPDHPTFGVSNQPHELSFWRDSLDVIGLDPYPLMKRKAGRPLTLVGDWTRAARQATFRSQPVWMVIQFFQGWSTDRWPAEEELRTMSLMAITEGARGLFYWSYGARGLMWVKDPQQREEYWRRLVSVTRELRSLEPALVAPDAPESVRSVSDRRIRWLARVADDKCYVFAYMPAESFVEAPAAAERTEVRFTLADGQTITRTFRPDSADWFAVSLHPGRSP